MSEETSLSHPEWLRMMAKYCDVLDADTRWRLVAVAVDYERMERALDEITDSAREDEQAVEDAQHSYCMELAEGLASGKVVLLRVRPLIEEIAL